MHTRAHVYSDATGGSGGGRWLQEPVPWEAGHAGTHQAAWRHQGASPTAPPAERMVDPLDHATHQIAWEERRISAHTQMKQETPR